MDYQEVQMIRNTKGTYYLERNYNSDVIKIYAKNIDTRNYLRYKYLLSLNYFSFATFVEFRLFKIKAYDFMSLEDKEIYSAIYKRLLFEHNNII